MVDDLMTYSPSGPYQIPDEPHHTFRDTPAVDETRNVMPTAVPEPSGIALVLVALLAAWTSAKRKAHKSIS